jgi:hypothetical protein
MVIAVVISFAITLHPLLAHVGPDLAITTTTIDPTSPTEGTKTTFVAVVLDQGDETAFSFRVVAILDGVTIRSDYVSSLSPSTTKAFSVRWTATVGQHQLCWIADPDTDVHELDKSNNRVCVSFTVAPTAYQVTVFIAMLPATYSTNIFVDGANVGVLAGGGSRSFSFPGGTVHIITIDQYVSGGPDERFYAQTNSWTLQSSDTKTFQYQRQFYLAVGTNPVGIASIDGGWYAEGQQVTLAAPLVTGYIFSYWSLDGTNYQTTSLSIKMDSPHRVVANYAASSPTQPPTVDIRFIIVGAVILIPAVVFWVVKKGQD